MSLPTFSFGHLKYLALLAIQQLPVCSGVVIGIGDASEKHRVDRDVTLGGGIIRHPDWVEPV